MWQNKKKKKKKKKKGCHKSCRPFKNVIKSTKCIQSSWYISGGVWEMVLLGLFQNTAKQLSKAPERMFKVVLAGDAAVGKSSLIMRLCKGKFVSNLSSTLGKLHLGYLTSTVARFAFCVFPCILCLCRLSVYYHYYYYYYYYYYC